MGRKMQPLVSAVDGTVVVLRHQASGNSLYIKGDDGWYYDYLHINNDTPGTDDGANRFDHAFAPGLGRRRVASGRASTSPTWVTAATPRAPPTPPLRDPHAERERVERVRRQRRALTPGRRRPGRLPGTARRRVRPVDLAGTVHRPAERGHPRPADLRTGSAGLEAAAGQRRDHRRAGDPAAPRPARVARAHGLGLAALARRLRPHARPQPDHLGPPSARRRLAVHPGGGVPRQARAAGPVRRQRHPVRHHGPHAGAGPCAHRRRDRQRPRVDPSRCRAAPSCWW